MGLESGEEERKEEELHYLWLSQHCVEVECLGGAWIFGTII